MSEAMKPTPGPWIADDNESYSPWRIWSRMTPTGHGEPGRLIAEVIGADAQADDDARLIAEAGTVFHETQLSPRQLVEQRDELASCLGTMQLHVVELCTAFRIPFPQATLDRASAAIPKCEGSKP